MAYLFYKVLNYCPSLTIHCRKVPKVVSDTVFSFKGCYNSDTTRIIPWKRISFTPQDKMQRETFLPGLQIVDTLQDNRETCVNVYSI